MLGILFPLVFIIYLSSFIFFPTIEEMVVASIFNLKNWYGLRPGAAARGVIVKLTGCGFDPHLRR